jgi:hypothetical protein
LYACSRRRQRAVVQGHQPVGWSPVLPAHNEEASSVSVRRYCMRLPRMLSMCMCCRPLLGHAAPRPRRRAIARNAVGQPGPQRLCTEWLFNASRSRNHDAIVVFNGQPGRPHSNAHQRDPLLRPQVIQGRHVSNNGQHILRRPTRRKENRRTGERILLRRSGCLRFRRRVVGAGAAISQM